MLAKEVWSDVFSSATVEAGLTKQKKALRPPSSKYHSTNQGQGIWYANNKQRYPVRIWNVFILSTPNIQENDGKRLT
ncbi:hypothetical protein J6590_014413 [Homalodisca vitripennis]|nr:hypothetical protein J6590_014413 [Homalodisca vitripennis]